MITRLLTAAMVFAVGCGGSTEKVASLPPPEVSVSQAVQQNVTEYFETTGRTAAIESVEVRARVTGYLVDVSFLEGAEVHKGDLLFQIDPRPFEAEVHAAEGELARWRAQLTKSQADVARNRSLLPKGAASQREVDTSIAQKETADAEIKAGEARLERARLDLEYSRITAPIDGRVSRANVTEGNLISLSGASSDVLTTIVSTNPIYMYFDVDERTLLRYQAGARERRAGAPPDHIKELKLPVEIGLATEEGFPHAGVLDFVDNQVDPATGTIRARGVYDNSDRGLTPGLFCRVRLPLQENEGALMISDRAVGTDQDGKYVLVVNDSNVVEYRPVKLGLLAEGMRAIQTGVAAGEWVITNGIQRVRPGVTVKPQQTSAAAPGA